MTHRLRSSHLPVLRNPGSGVSESDLMSLKFFLEDLGQALWKHLTRKNTNAKVWNSFVGNKGTRLVLQWKTHPAWKTPDSQFVAQAYNMPDGTFDVQLEYSYMFEGDGFDRRTSINYDPDLSVRPEVVIARLMREVSRWDLAMHRTGGLMDTEKGVKVANHLPLYLSTEGTGSLVAARRALTLAADGPKALRQIWPGARPA
jgi:hypothetical protein